MSSRRKSMMPRMTSFGYAILSFLVIFALLSIGGCAKPGLFSGDKTIRVAVCQILSLDGDRAGNFARIENALQEAQAGEAEIACFPETALLGWVNPEAHERAHPIPGPDSERLGELAAAHQIYIAIGLAEKDGERLYDSVILIDDKGNLLLKHRKINVLSELMEPPYAAGEDVQIAETRFGSVGLLICADTFRNEILDRMAALEPDLVLVPYGWAAREEQWPGHGKELLKTVSNAARRIGAPVVGTDLVGEITHGPWTGLTYGGLSVVSGAGGNVVALAADRDREVLLIDITL